MPRRNHIQRAAGILLIAGSVLLLRVFGVSSPEKLDDSIDLLKSSFPPLGLVIGVWLFAASFVYPKPQR